MFKVNFYSKKQIIMYKISVCFFFVASIILFILFKIFDINGKLDISKIFAILFLFFLFLFAFFCLLLQVKRIKQKNIIISKMDNYLIDSKYEEAKKYLEMFGKLKVFKSNYQYIVFYYGYVLLLLDDVEQSKTVFDNFDFNSVNYANVQIVVSYLFLYTMISVYKNDNYNEIINKYNSNKQQILKFVRNKEKVEDLFSIIDNYQMNNTIDIDKLRTCFYCDIAMIKRMCNSN